MVDFLGSIADLNAALELSEHLVSLLSLGGFSTTEFVINVPDLAGNFNPENSKIYIVK